MKITVTKRMGDTEIKSEIDFGENYAFNTSDIAMVVWALKRDDPALEPDDFDLSDLEHMAGNA